MVPAKKSAAIPSLKHFFLSASHGSRRLTASVFLLAGVAWLSSCQSAWSADDDEAAPKPAAAKHSYKELPVTDLKQNSTAVGSILMSGKLGNQQALFDDFYQKFFLARWTKVDNVTNLPGYRKELRNSHLAKKGPGAGPEAHEHLNALVLEFMKGLMTDNYHPAVQVNAMLMIGELNSVEGATPTPLPEALGLMTTLVNDPKISDAVRAAALVGIQRHVALNINDADARKALTVAMLKLANADLPTGAKKVGREWIVSQAADILGGLGSVGDNNAVFKALTKILANDKSSLSTRSMVAEALGKLNYTGANGIDVTATASLLAQLLVDACESELGKDSADFDNEVLRRSVHQHASNVLTALTGDGEASHKGLASLARDENQKKLVGGLQKSIETILTFLDDKKTEDEDAEKPIKKFNGELKKLLKKD
jgi:hypothetical protein